MLEPWALMTISGMLAWAGIGMFLMWLNGLDVKKLHRELRDKTIKDNNI